MAIAKTSNAAKYQQIHKRKQEDPSQSLTKLCGEAGVSYQSYNNWVKKNLRRSPTDQTGNNNGKARLVVQLSMEELVKLILANKKDYVMSVDRLLRSLDQTGRKRLAEEIGMSRLAELGKPSVDA